MLSLVQNPSRPETALSNVIPTRLSGAALAPAHRLQKDQLPGPAFFFTGLNPSLLP